VAKEKKMKKTKDESESEEDDFEFNTLRKKDTFKVMKPIERIQEQE
jgi:hypothetical protein